MDFKKTLASAAIAMTASVGALVATAPAANAYTVCNRYGDCWHETTRYHYPTVLGVRFYGDDWRVRHHWDGDNWRWRHHDWHWRGDHDGRGYWRDGVWITF